MAQVIDGKALAKKIRENLKVECNELKEKGIVPKLAVIMVGDNPASKVYVRNKSKACEEVGIEYQEFLLKENTNQQELMDLINDLNRNKEINGILLQSPIPRHLDINEAFKSITYSKDVDGFTPSSVGKLCIGEDTFIKEMIDIPAMKEICVEMLKNLWDALKNDDAELAFNIAQKDNEIDELYEKVRKDCLQVMHSNPTENINQGVRLVFIGRYLERIGDHITNICEKIIYAKNGEMIEIG